MIIRKWHSQISSRQRYWLYGTLLAMLVIAALGIIPGRDDRPIERKDITIEKSIMEIAPMLDVTGKALARELDLPLDAPKKKPLKALGVSKETLDHAVDHILSHRGGMLKYYIFAALALGGLIFLVKLGRPELSGPGQRKIWYPRAPYVAILIISLVAAGFILGKSPNPMESVVKVFKSMVGLYPDPYIKVIAFIFFIALAVIGNKLICGWACPYGALQELIFSLPVLKRLKNRVKLPFAITNTVRSGLFLVTLLLLFGIIGDKKGFVLYHSLNPFNLFNLEFETAAIALTVIITLALSFGFYRPFCRFICPFGLVSWIAEKFSVFRVRIDHNRCTNCGSCIKVCPTGAAKGLVMNSKSGEDCFSCGRCLNKCPVDAIKYGMVIHKKGV